MNDNDNDNWVGIQFNPIEGGIKTRTDLKPMGFDIYGDHITINFSRKELKRFDVQKGSEKLNIALSYLQKHLDNSDYTNVYTHLDASKLSNIKTELLETDFQNERIAITKLKDKSTFINNFQENITHIKVLNLINKNPIMKFMNAILASLVKKNVALDQELKLELGYEDKEEWDNDKDSLNISIQLEILQDKDKSLQI